MFGWLTARRRTRVAAEPFPPAWDDIIDANVAIARRLDPVRRQRLRELVQIFVAEKHWEGCGGMELDDEVIVTIAAQACLLILGRETAHGPAKSDGLALYRDVDSILVYPSSVITPPRKLFVNEQPRVMHGEGTAIRGEAMLGGPVVLAWDSVLAGGRGEVPGNVVLHELAHKLDMANGAVDGTPPLPNKAARRRWREVCTQAYARHRACVAQGWPTLMDAYGATNEAEFFAVATETFFTDPGALVIEHPALYGALAEFYAFGHQPDGSLA